MHDFPRHQHHFDAEHVVGGESVFQAMDAAGILGDVAADGARDLTRRVGRVVEPFVFDGLGNGQICNPGLGDDGAVVIVDFEDFVELAEPQGNGVGQRKCAAGKPGTGPPGDDLDLVCGAVFEDRRHLSGGLGQHHHQRQPLVGHQAVVVVDAELFFVGDHALTRNDGLHGLDDLGPAGNDARVRLRHFHRRTLPFR